PDGILRVDSSTGHEIIDANLNGHTVNSLVNPSSAARVDVSVGTVSFAPAHSEMSTTGDELTAKSRQDSRTDLAMLADSVALIDQDANLFADWSAADMAGLLLAPWLMIGMCPLEKRAAHLLALLEGGRERFDGIPNEL